MGLSSSESGAIAIVDTSFLVALHNGDDRFHEAATNTPLHGDRFLIPWEIWIEFVDVLLRVLPLKTAAQVLASTLEGPFEVRAVLQPEEFPILAAKSEKLRQAVSRTAGKGLSIFDLVVCTVAGRFREAILTFDGGITAAVKARLFPGARIA